MSVIGKYPGVFPEITDLSQITQNASTSIIGAVGEARKGSIFKRKYITSAAAMQNTYGSPDLKYGYMCHCMTCAMADAGEAYVVRVCSEDSKYAAVKIPVEEKGEVELFQEGFSITEVKNCEDESFFYLYEMDKTGHYVLDDLGQRIPITEGGNPVIDPSTVMTIVGENPNMDDIRVRMEETTDIPSTKKSVRVTYEDEEYENEDNETKHKYWATVITGTTDNGLEKGDKVIINKCPQSAFNGTFTVSDVWDSVVRTSYKVRISSGDSSDTTYYVEEAPKKNVGIAYNEKGNVARYVESPDTNFCYKFKTLALADDAAEYNETVYVQGSRLEDSTVTDEWFIPVISSNETTPGFYFVHVANESSTLEESIGNYVYATPDITSTPAGYYTPNDYDDLQIGSHRFMKADVPYSNRTDFVLRDGQWVVSNGTAETSSYVGGSQSVFFVYFGKYKFIKEGTYVYMDADLKNLATDEGLVEQGKAIDGALYSNVDSSYNLILKQYVPADTVLYTDSTLLYKIMSAGVGEYVYINDEPLETTLCAFKYQLNEKPSDPSEETIKGLSLRWVRAPSNNERKFDVYVYEVKDGVYNIVEQFNDCTLYNNVDGYNVQTKITSKINDKSNYIKVVLNDFLMKEDEMPFPLMTSTLTGKLVGGSTDEAASNLDICKGWDMFKERDQVTVNLLMECGYATESDSSIKNKMLEIAEARRDCFCVFDVPVTCTDSGTDQVVENYRKNTLGIDSYRSALYTPWVKVYDSFSGTQNVLLPPSGYVCGVIARTDTNRGVWVAPAGMNNGQIGCAALTPTGLTNEYTTEEQGSIYSNGVNYIRKTSGLYLLWGQKTLQFKASALDRINVVRMIIYIETSLRDAAKWHLFEQNTAYRRNTIKMQFEAWLDPIKAAGGLYNYKVVCDETNNTAEVRMNNQMYIDIYIQPEYAAEFIKLNTIVQRADATIGIVT